MKYTIAAALLITYGSAIAAELVTPDTIAKQGQVFMASQYVVTHTATASAEESPQPLNQVKISG